MKKLLFTIALIISGSVCSVSAQISAEASARLQTVLDSVSNKYHIRGVSTAIIVPGTGTWKGVHGTSANGNPLTPDMLFGIGSNTKTYTSCIMLLLQEKGVLNLDDTIGTWIKDRPNISGKITIRQLLNHTSGLYNYTTNPSFNDSLIADFARVWNAEAILDFVGKPVFSPGKSWQYSNTNYILAGLIIEKVTGKSYPEVLREFILDPQHFSHTILFPFQSTTDVIASPWSTLNIPGYPQFDVLDSGYANEAMFSLAWSAGGIMATAEDDARFWDALISGHIISDASMKQMRHYISIGINGGHRWYYGLGIFMMDHAVNNHTVFSHGGTILGYIAENIVDSSTGITISVLTNQDSITNDKVQQNVIRPLHKALLDMHLTAIAQAAGQDASISIYPNPAKDYIMLQLNNDEENNTVQLYDVKGRLLLSKNNIPAGLSRLPLENIMPGLYICRVISGNGQVLTQKLELRN